MTDNPSELAVPEYRYHPASIETPYQLADETLSLMGDILEAISSLIGKSTAADEISDDVHRVLSGDPYLISGALDTAQRDPEKYGIVEIHRGEDAFRFPVHTIVLEGD